MKKCFLVVLAFLALAGCQTGPVRNNAELITENIVQQGISLPSSLPVAFYAEDQDFNKIIKYYNIDVPVGMAFVNAIGVVMPSYFTKAERLTSKAKFEYIFKFKSVPEFSYGQHRVKLETTVIDREGRVVFHAFREESRGSQGAAGVLDLAMFQVAYAAALKETLIQFVNQLGANGINAPTNKATANLRALFPNIKPLMSGTGFFIDRNGTLTTAAHVTNSCLYMDVKNKGVATPAKLVADSSLLDISVLSADLKNTRAISIKPKGQNASLGDQVFVTGYPLASIMSDYPSLTVGNVSSLGGLKGARGYFQFSAPVQPGNSGGPITDYKGHLVGLVTSSLNQYMMLNATGTTSQNVNFGLSKDLILKFYEENKIPYGGKLPDTAFEQASKDALDYTTQVLCYN